MLKESGNKTSKELYKEFQKKPHEDGSITFAMKEIGELEAEGKIAAAEKSPFDGVDTNNHKAKGRENVTKGKQEKRWFDMCQQVLDTLQSKDSLPSQTSDKNYINGCPGRTDCLRMAECQSPERKIIRNLLRRYMLLRVMWKKDGRTCPMDHDRQKRL